MQISEKLKELRAKHQVTYSQWSEESGIPEGTIKSILAGTTERPGFDVVCALITSLGESIDEFYTGRPADKPVENKSDAPIAEQHHYHHFHISALRGDMREVAKEAIESAHSSETYKNMHSNMVWWRWIAIALIVLVICWFTWDITHPNVGLIQYGSVLPAVTGMSTDALTFM